MSQMMSQAIREFRDPHRLRTRFRHRVFEIVCTLACASITATSLAQPAPAIEDTVVLQSYYSANGLLNRGLFDLAAAEYRNFLEQHPDHEKAPVARYGLGVSLHRMGEHAEATTALEPLKDQPDFEFDAEALTILGQSYLALDRLEPATEAFRSVLQRHRDHSLADDAAALLADALYRRGEYEAVGDPVHILIERWPDSPHRERAELLQALAVVARNHDEKAVTLLSEMLQRFPEGDHAARGTLLLAQSLHRLNRADEAAVQYRRVIETAPAEHAAPARYGLAVLLHQQEDLEESEDLLDEFLTAHQDHPLTASAHLLRGRVAFDRGRFEEATEHLEAVDPADPEVGDDAAYWRAKTTLRQGDSEAAAAQLAEALQQYPQSELAAEMLYDQAVALARADQLEAATAPLHRFLEEFASHRLAPEATHLVATTLHRLRRFDESADHVERFRRDHPDHSLRSAVDFLAIENAFLSKDYERAIDEARGFLKSHEEAETRDRAQYRLGLSLYHEERYDEARPILEQVTRADETEAAFRAALLALGDLHFQQGRWEEAVAPLTHYLQAGLDQPSADDALLKRGLARQRVGEPEKAIEDYSDLIDRFKESPHRIQAMFEQGQALVELDRFEEAARTFELLLDEARESRFAAHTLNHLGSIAMRHGDYPAAGEYFGRAVAASRDEALVAEALLAQGQALTSAQHFDRAEQIFDQYLDRFASTPASGEARARRAVAIARQDRPEEAVQTIDLVLQEADASLAPALHGTLLYEKAWALRALDRPQESAASYRSLLEVAEHRLQPHALMELAELESAAGNDGEAAKLLRRLLSLNEESLSEDLREQGLYRLAVAEMDLENHAEAAELLERFVSDFPESDRITSAHLLAGESLFQSGSHQRAIEHFQDVIEADAADRLMQPALLRLGECQNVLQNFAQAEETFSTFLERFPQAATWYQAQFGIGWARENLTQYEEAIEAYREVVGRHQGPTAARAQFQIGESLFALRRLEEAARELLKVDILYAYPEWSAAALYEAGRCFQEMSDPAQARRHFQQVVDRHGETRWAQLAADRLEEMSRSGLPGG